MANGWLLIKSGSLWPQVLVAYSEDAKETANEDLDKIIRAINQGDKVLRLYDGVLKLDASFSIEDRMPFFNRQALRFSKLFGFPYPYWGYLDEGETAQIEALFAIEKAKRQPL